MHGVQSAPHQAHIAELRVLDRIRRRSWIVGVGRLHGCQKFASCSPERRRARTLPVRADLSSADGYRAAYRPARRVRGRATRECNLDLVFGVAHS